MTISAVDDKEPFSQPKTTYMLWQPFLPLFIMSLWFFCSCPANPGIDNILGWRCSHNYYKAYIYLILSIWSHAPRVSIICIASIPPPKMARGAPWLCHRWSICIVRRTRLRLHGSLVSLYLAMHHDDFTLQIAEGATTVLSFQTRCLKYIVTDLRSDTRNIMTQNIFDCWYVIGNNMIGATNRRTDIA